MKQAQSMENKKVKILLIEDSVDDADLIRRKLKKTSGAGFIVTVASRLEDGLELIAKSTPDLILSDLGLPDSHGLDTITKLLLAVPDIPVVVLSGFNDESTAMKAVQAGAQDYLVKGQLDNTQLERTIYYSIERARLQAELEQHTQEITKVQANLQKILENNADAIVVVGENKRIIFTNPAFELLLHRSQKELLSQPFEFPLAGEGRSEIEIKLPGKETVTAEMSVVKISWEGSPAYLASLRDISKRKQMENALKESEEKFSVAFRSSPDIIAIGNLKKEIYLEVNDSYTRATGYARKEIIGHPMSDINMWVNPDDSLRMIRLVQEQGKITNEEFTFRMKSGEVRQWLCSAELITIGGDPCIMSVATDITERKQMEKSLRESEEKFSKAFHSSANSFGICRLDNGNFIEVNESFLRLTGYTREEILGNNANRLNLWSSQEEHDRITRKTREFKTVRNEQIGIRQKSGQFRSGLFSSEQITINSEPCFINTITDITELTRAEEALRVSEEKFSKAFLRSPEVILISNIDDGTIFEANDTFLRLTGYSREEVIGKKAPELGLWAIPEQRAEIAAALKEKGTVNNKECQFRMKSGEIRTWLFSGEIINIEAKPRMLSVTIDITRRKQIEEELSFSDTVLKSLHEAVFAMDNEFIINRWNGTCEQIYGIKASDAIGKSSADIIHMVEDYEGQNAKRVNLLLEKGFNQEEQKHRTVHGDIWLDVHAQAIEKNGQRYGWISLATDISQRKKTEEALRFSDAAFKSIHESVIATDTNRIVTHWNKMSEKIFGVKASEAIGKNLEYSIDIVETNPGETETREKIMESGDNYRGEVLHHTSHGDVWVDVASQAIEENGKRYGWVILSTDITQRKLAEEALRQSEEKFRELINTSNDGIVAIDTQRKFIVWNQGAEKLLGYTEKDMLGLSVMTIFPASEQKEVAREFVTLKNTGISQNINIVFETYVLKKECSLLPVDISISARKTEGGYICTAIMRDITIRKAAEEKMKQIDQMKSEFLSNISHELRTPLQSIGGFTKLIMNGQVEDAATQQEFLQIIDRETMHLGNLINGLLDMSRLEAGRFRVYKKLVPVRDVFVDSLKMFRSLAREKNITLTENVSPEIPEMEIDYERLRQVVINLVGNAIKFSEPGSSVAVNAEKQPHDLLFQVTDHGIGINEESQKHLFERFYRAEGETVRGGTGLGLYISKQIIDAHGGRIWAQSKFGEGSTFSFTLPLNGKGGNGNGQENTGN
jgi:PAS domain S-box-containing protein